MSAKMKANPWLGSGRIWNLIAGVFRERPPPPPPKRLRNFCSDCILWRLASAMVRTATAAEQRPDTAMAALSSCSSVKFPDVYRLLTILGTLPVTTIEFEPVSSKLQRTLTSIRSTMMEDRLYRGASLAAVREHCLRQTTCSAHLQRKLNDLTSFCSRNCWFCNADWYYECRLFSFVFSYTYSALRCIAKQSFKNKFVRIHEMKMCHFKIK